MGSCFSRPSGHGQRLGSTTGSGEEVDSAAARRGTTAATAGPEDRAQRAAAAEARRQAAAKRGTGAKQGQGPIARKLEEEQRSGGTGNRGPEMPERQDWN